jgi:hypothetical protein
MTIGDEAGRKKIHNDRHEKQRHKEKIPKAVEHDAGA